MQEFVGIFIFLMLAISFSVAVFMFRNIFCRNIFFKLDKTIFQVQEPKRNKNDAKFIMYVILFLLFDVETVMLCPFAVVAGKLGLFAFIEGIIFVLIMFAWLFYVAGKNVLRWK